MGARRLGQRVFPSGGDEHQFFQPFRVRIGIFNSNGTAKGVGNENELFREFQIFDDGVQVRHHFRHCVVGLGGVALAVAAQIWSDDAVILTREIVDLKLP